MVEWKITVDGVFRLQPNAMVSSNLGKQLPEIGVLLITVKIIFYLSITKNSSLSEIVEMAAGLYPSILSILQVRDSPELKHCYFSH